MLLFFSLPPRSSPQGSRALRCEQVEEKDEEGADGWMEDAGGRVSGSMHLFVYLILLQCSGRAETDAKLLLEWPRQQQEEVQWDKRR